MHSSHTEILSNPKGCVVLAFDVKHTYEQEQAAQAQATQEQML